MAKNPTVYPLAESVVALQQALDAIDEAMALERQLCIEELLMLHEMAGRRHNFYQFAAKRLST